MLRKLLMASVLVLSMALAACGAAGRESGGNIEPAPDPGGDPPAEQPGERAPIAYEDVDMNSLTDELTQWVEEMRQSEGAYVFHADGGSYVLVAMGEQPTGGYDIQVTSVERQGDRSFFVRTESTVPAPDAMVSEALTYPADLVFVPGGVQGSLEVNIGDAIMLLTLTV